MTAGEGAVERSRSFAELVYPIEQSFNVTGGNGIEDQVEKRGDFHLRVGKSHIWQKSVSKRGVKVSGRVGLCSGNQERG